MRRNSTSASDGSVAKNFLAAISSGPRGTCTATFRRRRLQDRRAESAPAGLRPCTPHVLRCSAITHLLERGTDALAVQAFARHEQLPTTTCYDRRREEAKREAARRLAELKRVSPAPLKPRPRRAPRKGKRGRGGRPHLGLLESRPRPQLIELARAHRVVVADGATRAELAAAIRAVCGDSMKMEEIP